MVLLCKSCFSLISLYSSGLSFDKSGNSLDPTAALPDRIKMINDVINQLGESCVKGTSLMDEVGR